MKCGSILLLLATFQACNENFEVQKFQTVRNMSCYIENLHLQWNSIHYEQHTWLRVQTSTSEQLSNKSKWNCHLSEIQPLTSTFQQPEMLATMTCLFCHDTDMEIWNYNFQTRPKRRQSSMKLHSVVLSSRINVG